MPKPQVSDSFLDLLEKSQLLSTDELESACEAHDLRNLPSAKHVAQTLVRVKMLTHYQAERLLMGRTRGFFIDHFKVEAILGFGGMGRIYVAEDTVTGERVALKVLTERHEVDASMLERLRLEAKAGMLLDHPNVVRTRKIGNTGAVTYVVMDYVEGLSLHEVIALGKKMRWAQAADVIAQGALGLHHAHEAGLVHRDIKPANLLIESNGHVKVLDFGLALIQDDEEAEFALAMIFGHDCLGTADYIAPEQSLHSHDVDARADVYSLGCTFYFLLAGQVPFPLPTVADKLVAQRMKLPPSITSHVPDIPRELVAILGKMMAKKPEDRYQTAAEVAAALEPFAQRFPLRFKFQEILTARAREATRRMKASHKQNQRTQGASSTTAATSSIARTSSITSSDQPKSLSTQQLQNHIETDIDIHHRQPAANAFPTPEPEPHEDELGRTATMRAAASSLPQTHTAFLQPLDGGPPLVLNQPKMQLGRSSGCDLVWDHAGISSTHCEISFVGNWWEVTDLNSKNGTQINGTDITSRMLMPGDQLTLAHKYHFRLTDPNAAPTGMASMRFALWVLALLIATTLTGLLIWWVS